MNNDKLTNKNGRSGKHVNLVNQVIRKIKQRYPNIFKSIEPILESVENNEINYYLIYGLVQSGKSLAISILMWILNYKYDIFTVFMTKNLDTIRRDIIHKLTKGIIIEIVKEMLKKHDISNYFLPEMVEFKDLKDIVKNNNKILKDLRLGTIPIILENEHNYPYIIEFVNKIKTRREHLIFIIDEYHTWFTDQVNFTENNGLTKSNSGMGILHWIHELNKKKDSKYGIIGITATPYRALADLHLFPHNIIHLEPDSPSPGLKYFSLYKHNNMKNTKKIKVKGYEYDKNYETYLFDILENIIIDQAAAENPGNKYPVILVTIERINDIQKKIKREIKKYFEGSDFRLKVVTCNQGDNDLQSCFTQFDHEIHDALVIIGSQKLNTGVTVKPICIGKNSCVGKSRCTVKNCPVQYVPNITDQILPRFTNMEHNVQLLRITGWHNKNAVCTIWVSDQEIELYKNDLFELSDTIIDKYKKNPSPKSIANIICKNKLIKKICGSKDMYKFSNRTNKASHVILDDLPENFLELEVTPRRAKSLKFGDKTIEYFYANKKLQNELRKDLGMDKVDAFDIPYTLSRERQIMRAIVDPQENNAWKINYMLYGAKGPKTLIKNCSILKFEEPWQYRTTIHDLSEGESLAFKIPGNKWIVYRCNTLDHKFINKIGSKLSDDHYKIIKEISEMKVAEKKKARSNPFLFFRKVVKSKGQRADPTACSILWKNENLKKDITKIFQSNEDENIKLEKAKICF